MELEEQENKTKKVIEKYQSNANNYNSFLDFLLVQWYEYDGDEKEIINALIEEEKNNFRAELEEEYKSDAGEYNSFLEFLEGQLYKYHLDDGKSMIINKIIEEKNLKNI